MAIIDPGNRPALPIALGTFGEPIADPVAAGDGAGARRPWKFLEDHRQQIDRAITCVGRIELEGHPYVQWAGAGTLVGPYRFLTAGHVVALFSRGRGDSGVTLKSDMKAFLTAGSSIGSRVEFKLPVTGVRFVHPFFNVALCELGPREVTETSADSEIGIPIGLTVAAETPAPLIGRKVAVIGFAADDPRNAPDVVARVFGSTILPTLYLLPGEIRSPAGDVIPPIDPAAGSDRPAISHDCSTLGGSAGAPLLDVETGEVLGVHYGGRFLVENQATPGWLLARDQRVRASGIQFAGDPDWMYKWTIADIAAAEEGRAKGPMAYLMGPAPAEPEPDPRIHYFSQTELYRIRDLLAATGLTRDDRQHLLFVTMSLSFIATLPTAGAPDARLVRILDILNQTPLLTSEELPMRTLLVNAVENSKEFPQSEKLREYLDRLPDS